MPAIRVENIHKSFKKIKILHGISFTIEKGTVFGLLGPNGMGKSTLIYIMCGLMKPNQGEVYFNSLSIKKNRRKIMQTTGVQLQESNFFENLTVSESIDYIKSLYPKTDVDINELIDILELNSKKSTLIKNLSGGQKQKLYLIMCIMNDPEILILDEPTTGLDIQSRRNVWQLIKQDKAKKKTILITTHYIDEAEALCDEIAFIDSGRIIAHNTLAGFMKKYENTKVVEFIIDNDIDILTIKKTPGYIDNIRINSTLIIYIEDKKEYLEKFIVELPEILNLQVKDITVRKANLEDVYLNLTGKKFD
ncbi:MAG: ABC transporter ATP-binding protein [Bacteroidales bacterium]|nr:ABC transporter ATP-binding protein [Bacteroidales bacterium]